MASVKYIPLDPGLIASSPSVVNAAAAVDDADIRIMDHSTKENPDLHIVIFPQSKEELPAAAAALPESPAAAPTPTPTSSSSSFFPHNPLFVFLLLLMPVVLALIVYSLIEFIMPLFVLLVHNL